jgi:hypothetical protein
MRRRRQALQVSTFPFLAVLLCAMGALILLLLVIDRRAKAVSRAKAEQAATRAVSEEAKLAAAQQASRQAEWEQRRRQLHELLAREEETVVSRIKAVQDKTAATRLEVDAEETRIRELRQRLQAELGQVARTQDEVASKRAGIARAGDKVEASKQDLARLAGELARLEQTLRDLRALREREKQTYSLVPYLGRHGDSRRPIYVECTAAGLVFHPDRLVLEGPSLSPMRIRAEVERRIARSRTEVQVTALQSPAGADKSAYLLMLVRPNGIASYYRTQTALVGLKIDFGYEFVEPDWILDFAGDDNTAAPQPWMTAGGSKSDAPGRGADTGLRRPVPAGIGRYRGIGGPGQRADGEADHAGTEAAQGQMRTGVAGIGPTAGGSGSGVLGVPSAGLSTPSIPYPPGGGPHGALAGAGGDSPGGKPVLLRPTGVGEKPAMTAIGFGNGLPGQGATGASNGSGPGSQGTADGGPWFAAGARNTSPTSVVSVGTAPAGGPARFGNPGSGPADSGHASPSPGTATNLSSGPPPAETGASASGLTTGGHDGSERQGVGPSASGAANPAPGGDGIAATLSGGGVRNGPPVGEKSVGQQPGDPTTGSASGSQAIGGGQRTAGQGESGGEPGTPVSPYLSGPSTGKAYRLPPLPLSRLLGNRDWPILVECQADVVLVRALSLRVPAASLESSEAEAVRLVQAVQKMIADRQAAVRPGEPPYRPLIRFQVHPDALRIYYLIYPRFETLGLPLTRENIQPPRGPQIMER